VETGEELRTLSGRAIAFSPDGEMLATSAGAGSIVFWSVKAGARLRTLKIGIGNLISSMAFSPDGRFLASNGGRGSVKLWSVQDGHQVQLLSGPMASVTSLTFSMNGKMLAACGYDPSIEIWKLEEN